MDESPFGEAPEETAAVIAALREERNDDFPRAVRALRNRNFRLFWTGNFLSNIGTWMQNVAQGWLVLTLTNSSFWLGVVGFAGSIPFLIFTLFGGVSWGGCGHGSICRLDVTCGVSRGRVGGAGSVVSAWRFCDCFTQQRRCAAVCLGIGTQFR